MMERLGTVLPLDSTHPTSSPKALAHRLQEAMDRETRPTPDPITKPTPPLTPEELIRGMVVQWWSSEFMRTMLFEDEEKTGVKAEPYA